MNLGDGVGLVAQGAFMYSAGRVILAGTMPRRRRPPMAHTRAAAAISGPCPNCGGTITVPATGQTRWTEPCDDCGMRLVGVLDPARSGTELLWLPVQAQPMEQQDNGGPMTEEVTQ